MAAITGRPRHDSDGTEETVRAILDDVRENGDSAVRKYGERFDGTVAGTLAVTDDEISHALAQVEPRLLDALRLAHDNIRRFHEAQDTPAPRVETRPGVTCWQKSVPIDTVGLYIPGGTAPLFSTVLMLATPAVAAGCPNIIMCTPPRRDGTVDPAILAAAHTAGVHRIYKIGGVQAIAAMAYGTESVPKVHKIFGPGNRYVMTAKQIVSVSDVAIDMPAGPSEVCVIADHNANPEFVAADMLSQAEHGTDSQAVLITTSATMLDSVERAIRRQTEALPRRDFIRQSLDNSRMILVNDTDEAMAISNAYAPEHLIIDTDDHDRLAAMVTNAGSVFLGRYACESAGDYASGTNHTLPTHGYAVAYSGVNLDSYRRKITFQHITPEGIDAIGEAVETMAAAERLDAHRNAMALRVEECRKMKGQKK